MSCAPPLPDAPQKLRILDVGISTTSYDEVCDCSLQWAQSKQPAYIVVCNVYSAIQASSDSTFAQAINQAAIATPDGMPLVWSLRRLGAKGQQRVYGPDLLLAFAAKAADLGEGIGASYFYGAGVGVAEELGRELQRRYPGFTVAGAESPPFRELTPEEDAKVVERINNSGAEVLWVGLGSPKQERWMAEHAGRIHPVMIGVGAAFDFLTGRVPQAPRWMMRYGLEWLFRLAV
ncbi:MAG: WecB/TagA/CpsF family glycosyltransferase, partial [Planctomycetes bacterium]|nr:WecB/TagA/CpsF family glycosyltransferase [Planctomycetota bacterium]